ncbi:hypothetical protein [Aquimarina agarilytica]|uniref:hypothetical protein n=1 Tax=Aquimarina agarilytica TaxID=1087449 RepID=UPI0002899858|nr:hypothetical protein [Aquimarina agarilytica]
MNLGFNLKSIASLAFASALLFSCSSDDTAVFDTPTDPEEIPTNDATIRFIEGGTDNKSTADITGEAGGTVKGRVIFETTGTQRRLYVTQTLPGGAEMPFLLPLDKKATRRATKADGSIDLDAENKKALDFTLDLDVPSEMSDGKIIYNFWTTTGKGDFRNPDKRKSQGVGTITVSIGTGVNPAAKVLEFNGVKLFAPDSEGKTETFFSLLNGNANRIDQGPEFRAFWDFGYYYGASGVSKDQEASLVSVKDFDETFGFPVKGLKPGANEEDAANETLNQTYFSLSTKTTVDFDDTDMAGQLESIIKSASTNITNLTVGDVVEFVDQYGKKGLIKVNDIEPGFANDDFILIDIKVQP